MDTNSKHPDIKIKRKTGMEKESYAKCIYLHGFPPSVILLLLQGGVMS